jgi:hypothetical protein
MGSQSGPKVSTEHSAEASPAPSRAAATITAFILQIFYLKGIKAADPCCSQSLIVSCCPLQVAINEEQQLSTTKDRGKPMASNVVKALVTNCVDLQPIDQRSGDDQ